MAAEKLQYPVAHATSALAQSAGRPASGHANRNCMRNSVRYRLGLNQPAESPTAQRMAQMAASIERETQGGLTLEVHPESRLGPDPRMFADLQAGKLEFYLSGATLGGVAPSSALPLLPYAFTSSAAVFAALDGALGEVIRCELAADFFKTLGAEAGMVPFSGMYEALKAHQFDGQSDPLGIVQSLRLYEVQTNLSLTGHWWSGFTLLAHADAWHALPADIKWVVERNVEAFAKRQRADVERVNAEGETVLEEQGMAINRADTASIRAHLGLFYARWKAKFPAATWRLLETYADGLG